MRRREFLGLLGGAAVCPLAAPAQQQPERMRRIGVLMGMTANDAAGRAYAAALNQGLQELGWIDDRNLQIKYNWSGTEPDRLQASAKELVELRCEVIVANSTPVVAALLRETHTIPIVFVVVVDPIGSGFVQSYARPGANVTGFQNYEFTMVGKWVQILSEIAPLRRIAYLYNPTTAPLESVRTIYVAPACLTIRRSMSLIMARMMKATWLRVRFS